MLHRLPLPGRLGTSLSERRKAADRWVEWAGSSRPPGRLLWLHAASVGETIAAGSVIQRLRVEWPDLIVAHTFTSPSVAGWPLSLAVDRSDYAPEDSAAALDPVFAALRPSALVISRGDLWPGMARAAERAQVPIAVIGGSISPKSLRLRWPARALMNRTCRPLGFVGALTRGDATRWRRMGARHDAVSVTGDPRDAGILERPVSIGPLSTLVSWGRGRSILVAGSTHPGDERLLAETFPRVARARPEAALLVIPHDPGRPGPSWHDAAFEWDIWTDRGDAIGSSCVFAPVKGLLADLYSLGRLAYVGGGFDRGAHSVGEPAVFGLPIVAGPHSVASSEPRRFVESGALTVLPARDTGSALERWWTRLLESEPERWRVGLEGRALLDAAGARISAEAIRGLLQSAEDRARRIHSAR